MAVAVFLSTLPLIFVGVMVYRHHCRPHHRRLLALVHKDWRRQLRSIRRLPERRP